MIEHIIIISLFTIGYCCTFWPGMIFEKIGDWLEVHLPEWVNKPLWQCYICTCFWIGSGVYWLVWHKSALDWFVTVVAAMGVNAVISEFTNKTEEVEVKGMPEIKIEPAAPLRAGCPNCNLWQQCEYGFSGKALCAECGWVIANKEKE